MADKNESKQEQVDTAPDEGGELTQEEIQQAIKNLDMKAGDEAKETLELLMKRAMELGSVPKTALGISDQMMEAMYAHAYNLYNQGMYAEAGYMFRVLIMLNMTETKYIMGLAASLHMSEEYETAIQMYALYGMMEKSDPLCWYHSSDCYMKMGNPIGAKLILQQALRECAGKTEHKLLEQRIKMMIEALEDDAMQQFVDLAEDLEKVGAYVDEDGVTRIPEQTAASSDAPKKKRLKKKKSKE